MSEQLQAYWSWVGAFVSTAAAGVPANSRDRCFCFGGGCAGARLGNCAERKVASATSAGDKPNTCAADCFFPTLALSTLDATNIVLPTVGAPVVDKSDAIDALGRRFAHCPGQANSMEFSEAQSARLGSCFDSVAAVSPRDDDNHGARRENEQHVVMKPGSDQTQNASDRIATISDPLRIGITGESLQPDAVGNRKLSFDRLMGSVRVWKGRHGWIEPDVTTVFPTVQQGRHRCWLYVNLRDVECKRALRRSARVSFHWYSDAKGLGAAEVREEYTSGSQDGPRSSKAKPHLKLTVLAQGGRPWWPTNSLEDDSPMSVSGNL